MELVAKMPNKPRVTCVQLSEPGIGARYISQMRLSYLMQRLW